MIAFSPNFNRNILRVRPLVVRRVPSITFLMPHVSKRRTKSWMGPLYLQPLLPLYSPVPITSLKVAADMLGWAHYICSRCCR